MVIDGKGKRHLQSERLKRVRANIAEARRLRKEWNQRRRDAQLRREMAPNGTSIDEDEPMMSLC